MEPPYRFRFETPKLVKFENPARIRPVLYHLYHARVAHKKTEPEKIRLCQNICKRFICCPCGLPCGGHPCGGLRGLRGSVRPAVHEHLQPHLR